MTGLTAWCEGQKQQTTPFLLTCINENSSSLFMTSNKAGAQCWLICSWMWEAMETVACLACVCVTEVVRDRDERVPVDHSWCATVSTFYLLLSHLMVWAMTRDNLSLWQKLRVWTSFQYIVPAVIPSCLPVCSLIYPNLWIKMPVDCTFQHNAELCSIICPWTKPVPPTL